MLGAMKGFHRLMSLPEERLNDKVSRRVLSGDRIMLTWWSVKAGASAPPHSHPHEQIFWILKGRMEFRIEDQVRICGPGDMGVVPGGVIHENRFLEDSETVEVFAPPREDFLGTAPSLAKFE
jgi:quercetin dioxygenase-like cupin family protein